MKLPRFLDFRRPKGIRFSDFPYARYTDSLNPLWLMYELYRQPVCQVNDERVYSNEAVKFLEEKARLVGRASSIEDINSPNEGDDFMRVSSERDTRQYLWRDNLFATSTKNDGLISLTSYHPVNCASVHDAFKSYIVESKGDARVSVLISRNGSLVANKISFAPPILDLELNYGTGFTKVHETIMDKLAKKKAGLLLFHGIPGSGKSTYLKYLTSVINREFIFIPVGMAGQLASPDFISLLTEKKEAVLILEDAEQAVQERGNGGNDSAVSTLLNLADGILGSILNITVIVTYNADKQYIDKALLRKGRLSFDYDFGPLKVEDARQLATHLGKTLTISEPTTLADIYGAEDDTNYQAPTVRRMGF